MLENTGARISVKTSETLPRKPMNDLIAEASKLAGNYL